MDTADELDQLHTDPAELALIGAVASHPDALAAVLADLPGNRFYRVARGVVWDACRALSAASEPIDPVTVGRWLLAHDQWDMRTLHGDVRHVVQVEMVRGTSSLSASHAVRYAEQISEAHRRRELVALGTGIRQLAIQRPGEASEILAEIRARVDAIDQPARQDHGPLDWDAMIDEFEQAHHPAADRVGIPSPWWELDQLLGGLFGGRVYVWGGRPGTGKSTAALIVAMHAAAECGRQALVISKEMPTVDVTGRILARAAEVPLTEINSRSLSDLSRARIRHYLKTAGRPPIHTDDKPRTLGAIKTLARAHKHRHGLDVLVVDYVQLVRTDTPARTREQEVAEVSIQLKALALELDCVVCLPAQLNRESGKRADPRPTMSDLRDSGQLEQDADAIILLHRPTNPDGTPTGRIQFIVDKNRHGPTAEISLRWHGGYGAIA